MAFNAVEFRSVQHVRWFFNFLLRLYIWLIFLKEKATATVMFFNAAGLQVLYLLPSFCYVVTFMSTRPKCVTSPSLSVIAFLVCASLVYPTTCVTWSHYHQLSLSLRPSTQNAIRFSCVRSLLSPFLLSHAFWFLLG